MDTSIKFIKGCPSNYRKAACENLFNPGWVCNQNKNKVCALVSCNCLKNVCLCRPLESIILRYKKGQLL